MNLSIPTLQFTDLIVFLTCGIVFVGGWVLHREKRSFLLFGASFFLCAAMSIGFDDFGSYGQWLSPLGWSLAGSLFWIGFRVFDGRFPVTRLMAILTALPTVLHVCFGLAGVDEGTVNVVTTLTYALHEGAVAFYVLSTSSGSTIRRVAGLALAAIVVAICTPLLSLSPDVEHLSLVFIVVTDHITSVILTTAILALEAERAYVELEKIALSDPLTGALNRKGLDRELHGRRGAAGVITVDLDHFKSVNDRFGHAAGDHVLRKFVIRALSVLPETSFLARFGGEEFVVVLPNHDRNATVFLAERLRFVINNRLIDWNGRTIAVTVSLGVAMADDLKDLGSAIEIADVALYEAKTSGRNRVQVA